MRLEAVRRKQEDEENRREIISYVTRLRERRCDSEGRGRDRIGIAWGNLGQQVGEYLACGFTSCDVKGRGGRIHKRMRLVGAHVHLLLQVLLFFRSYLRL